jgi:hypothetical protein
VRLVAHPVFANAVGQFITARERGVMPIEMCRVFHILDADQTNTRNARRPR